MKVTKATTTLILYCLPCIAALVLILSGYYARTQKVAKQIGDIAMSYQDYKITQTTLDSLEAGAVPDTILEKLENMKDRSFAAERFKPTVRKYIGDMPYIEYRPLILKYARIPEEDREAEMALQKDGKLKEFHDYFKLQKKLGNLQVSIKEIPGQISLIWQRNSLIVALMVFLPYLLLGFRLAFDKKVGLTPSARMTAARRHWAMKFVVACVMTIGWIYVVNPTGRGANTVAEYLIAENVIKENTLPTYISATAISHTVAGFLGWYLYLLMYFFRKLYHNDVVSARVYRFLFAKFLFTYGIALTFSAVLGDEAKTALFLIGFFPLSAVSVLKEYGLKAAKGISEGKATLSELPGISIWQITRLEEEGIDSISTLANYDQEKVDVLPRVMRPLVGFWMDVARLYTILGEEGYQKIKAICQTANEFVSRAKDKAFQASLKAVGIENPEEILHLLLRTFPVLAPGDGRAQRIKVPASTS